MHEVYDFLHIMSVALFFGGIIASLVLLFLAEKRGRADALRAAMKHTRRINTFVTAPGIALIIVSGIFQTAYTGDILSQGWLVAGLMLFVLSVLVWLVFFIPAHRNLFRIAVHSSDPLPPAFFTLLHRLYFFGAVIIILPLGTMTFSILKPNLW